MINVLGWYGRNNCGDEAFKDAFEVLFRGEELSFTVEKIEEEASRLILGGGDVVKPYYLDVIPNDKPIELIGVGLGYESEIELLASKKVTRAFFRNKEDVKLAQEKGINAVLCPDLAFLLPKPDGLTTPVPRSRPEKKKLAVLLSDNVNPTLEFKRESYYAEYFKSEMAESLDYLNEWYEIYFLPLSHELYSFDCKMHMDVANRMRKPIQQNIYTVPKTPRETIEFIAQMDLVVTAKFHGIIFSVLAGVPYVSVGLTRKTELFCYENELQDLSVPPFSFLKSRFLENVKVAEDPNTRDLIASVRDEKKLQWCSLVNQYF